MENPLLELQEYENLQEALKKAKGGHNEYLEDLITMLIHRDR